MNDVRFPIETVRDGNKITKTCVEDVYKIVNRVYAAMNKAYNNSVEVLESLQREDFDEESYYLDGEYWIDWDKFGEDMADAVNTPLTYREMHGQSLNALINNKNRSEAHKLYKDIVAVRKIARR